MNSEKSERLVSPYTKLGCIYDEVMSHVDYQHWAKYIQKIIRKWHPQTKRILDISCGTASLLLMLDSKKYELFGFDLSYDMLKVAQQKFDTSKFPISLWQGNMISFRLRHSVDIVICLYDSINYLLNLVEWKKLFDCVYDVLCDSGLFIFDICTEKNSKKHFNNYFEKKSGDYYQYIRESSYNKKDKIHRNRFVIYFDSEKECFVELHRQQIYLFREVENFIATTNFKLLNAFDGFTFNRGNENSLRIHFVLKK